MKKVKFKIKKPIVIPFNPNAVFKLSKEYKSFTEIIKEYANNENKVVWNNDKNNLRKRR
jgi:hypothetical protein